MKIAALQSEVTWEDPEANFEHLEPWIARAAAAGADIVALPEMFACGFSMRTERIAEPPRGPSTRFLTEAARRHRLWLAGSLPEQAEASERPFNTLVMAGPEGQLERYRKIHPFTFAGEDRHYAAGDRHVTVSVEGLRVTLFVCYDLRFANEFWVTAPDTDAYLVVANWPAPRRHHWRCLLRARAIENQAYVVGVNRVGRDEAHQYAGDTCVVDPSGEVLASAAAQETMVLADLDAGRVRQARERFPVMQDRRQGLTRG
jgi:predicted amidohydrolase